LDWAWRWTRGLIFLAMGARRHGQGDVCPWKCCKVLFVLQMFSTISVHEVSMHYFETMSSASGGLSPQTPTGVLRLDPRWGTSVL